MYKSVGNVAACLLINRNSVLMKGSMKFSLDGRHALRSLQFGTLHMGRDHVEWFLGAVGFPSLEGEDFEDRVVSPKNGVNSRDIKLHALRYQKDQSR